MDTCEPRRFGIAPSVPYNELEHHARNDSCSLSHTLSSTRRMLTPSLPCQRLAKMQRHSRPLQDVHNVKRLRAQRVDDCSTSVDASEVSFILDNRSVASRRPLHAAYSEHQLVDHSFTTSKSCMVNSSVRQLVKSHIPSDGSSEDLSSMTGSTTMSFMYS